LKVLVVLKISPKLLIQLKGMRFKANYVTEKYGYDCFADDTGLEDEA
jgi:hypothetical protein